MLHAFSGRPSEPLPYGLGLIYGLVLHSPCLDPIRLSYTWNLNSPGQCLVISHCPTQVSSSGRSQYDSKRGLWDVGGALSLGLVGQACVCIVYCVKGLFALVIVQVKSVLSSDHCVADILPLLPASVCPCGHVCSQTWGLATLFCKHSMHLGLWWSKTKAIVPFQRKVYNPQQIVNCNGSDADVCTGHVCLSVWLHQGSCCEPALWKRLWLGTH